MSYIVQQQDIEILYQGVWEVYSKIEIVDSRGLTIAEIQGQTIEDSVSVDADSDIRRTASVTLHIENLEVLEILKDMIWFDKTVRLYTGIKNARTKEIQWYKLGQYVFNNSSYVFDAATSSLAIQCSDRMVDLTGSRAGSLPALETVIPVNSEIRDAMIETIKCLTYRPTYIIECDPRTVPFELTFNTGSSAYDIITKLRDLYPGYESYFDIDGVFHCNPLPILVDSPIILDDSILKDTVIVESLSQDFMTVRNMVMVYGASISASRFADTATNSGAQYNITLSAIAGTAFSLYNNLTVAFVPNVDNIANPTLRINSLSACPIKKQYVDDNYKLKEVPLEAGTMEANRTYVLKYIDGVFYYQGLMQIEALAIERAVQPTEAELEEYRRRFNTKNIHVTVNPDSPYCIEKIGEILIVQSGGEYDDIITEQEAIERAEYDLWTLTRLNDTITLDLQAMPWLDVNEKISYTSLNTGETAEYIVKSISNLSTTGGTMTVTASKFYPLYPYIIEYLP